MDLPIQCQTPDGSFFQLGSADEDQPQEESETPADEAHCTIEPSTVARLDQC